MTKEIKSGLDKLAVQLIQRASLLDAPTDAAVDIFKATSAYYLGTQRVSKGKTDDDQSPVSFGEILKKARNNTKGGTA